MKTLVGGAIAAVIGVIGLAIWFGAFLQLLAGVIPIMLLLGGCLALYLGFDELKDTWQNENAIASTEPGADADVGKFKKENEDLKAEIEALKEK
jgi:cell division protein FtsB